MAIRTRRDVYKLAQWDPILVWYARGIAEMQRRPINNPTSWRYQSAIHDYVRANDPNRQASDTLPSNADQRRFWRQCQHFSWYFLPWHRIYLLFFEQIVAAAVRQLGGPADWALPYWNYSDDSNPNARRLPPAFIATNLPNGAPNPLRVTRRRPGANNGAILGDADDVELSDCLEENRFVAQAIGGSPGFGGPRTAFNHSTGDAGFVESVPHGSMHMAVGGVGVGGWMSSFDTAALDPIFWLHHCNIDRLWSVWLRRDSAHRNPTDARWLTNLRFEFHNAAGQIVSMTPSQVVDTRAAALSYDYEDTSDPLGATETARRRPMEEEEERVPEMVGATDQPVTLAGRESSASVPVKAPTGPAGGREAGAAPRKVYLRLENITSEGEAESYQVYLNLPEGANPEEHRELYAGLLPMFGVAESSDPERGHPGSGLHYTLDITKVVRALEVQNAWNPDEMRVTFVPKQRPADRESGAVTAGSPVQVGRISVYYS